MKLSHLLSGVQIEERIAGAAGALLDEALGALEIAEVREDSRLVEPGDLFVALPGQSVDGHSFLQDAAQRGAQAAVVERPLAAGALPCVQLRVASAPAALAQLAANRHGRPADHLLLCGITGTNGKTTTAFLIESLLRRGGYEPGLIGTVLYRHKGVTVPAPLTTPGALALHAALGRMRADGVNAVVMETSSHALALSRLSGVFFQVAAFTNLTQDHLDFHGDMESYFQAKARLLREHLLSAERGGVAVVLLDGDYGQRMAQQVGPARLLTVSLEREADVCLVREESTLEGIAATLRTPAGEVDVRSPLIGRYNLENLAVAVGVGVGLGLPAEVIRDGLATVTGVPGRVERVRGEPGGPAVFVDFAHSPDALERVIAALRPLVSRREADTEPEARRLLVVFGCGGDRDKGKRAKMGQVAARDADVVVVTSDNPRTESAAAIIDMIVQGIEQGGLPRLLDRSELGTAARGYFIEPDRRQAIRAAIAGGRPGDVVLIAGKGHEDYQIIGATKHHFDDREEALAAMRARTGSRRQSGPGPGAPSGLGTPLVPSIDLPIERVLQATGGRLVRGGAHKFAQVVIDGRAAGPGALFVAVRGPLHDGHDFCEQAAGGGAIGVLAERGRGAAILEKMPDLTLIEVDDTVVALGQVARAHRDAPEIARSLRVVAVTGSNGKTTTKDLMGAILEAHGKGDVLRTEGNLNNHLGVPLTLLRLRAGHRYAVLELGMSARGEIAYLTSLCRPDVGVLTHVGPVHLASLGTVDHIAQAKGELFTGLLDGAAAVYPTGPQEDRIRRQAVLAGAQSGRLRAYTAGVLSKTEPATTTRADTGAEATVLVELLRQGPQGLELSLRCVQPGTREASKDAAAAPEGEITLSALVPLLGAHNALNAGLAAAAALALDVPPETIVLGLSRVSPGKHRGQLLDLGGRRVLDDCYNASPDSVLAALRTVAALRGESRSLLVLGDMLELGPKDEQALHRQIGEAAAMSGAELLIGLGPLTVHTVAAAAQRGLRALWLEGPEAAAERLAAESRPGDLILVKGSRGMQLERVLGLLGARLAPPGPDREARSAAVIDGAPGPEAHS